MKNRIAELRKEKGYSLNEVAEHIGVTPMTISRYENGKREPKLKTWKKLADFFGVSVPYLQGAQAVNVPALYIVSQKYDEDGGVLGVFTSKESAYKALEHQIVADNDNFYSAVVYKFNCIDEFDTGAIKEGDGGKIIRKYFRRIPPQVDYFGKLGKGVCKFCYIDYEEN